jgi:formylglycine-generating enzyme required for sulfatase activity
VGFLIGAGKQLLKKGRMRKMRKVICLAVVCVMAAVNVASADTIQGIIDMEFVTIGNAGNAGDTRGYGAVDHAYRIGKYEVTAAQWQTINTAAGIGDSGYWSGNQPVASISWYDAAQFCNYLTSGNKYSGAYKFDNSGNFQGIDRVSSISTYGTTYVIPTEDEWYKAAYFKPDGSGYSLYANGTSTAPVAGVNSNYDWAIGSPWTITNGIPEQNGTFDMMGNVWEWNETLFYGSYRGIRGGSYNDYGYGLESSKWISIYPNDENSIDGFRVASIVPEPCSLTLLFLGGLALRYRKR